MTLPVATKPIVFFDGQCGMCDYFIKLIARADRNHIFMFAPLQGETAKSKISDVILESQGGTMVYLDQDRIYTRSDAVLIICSRLSGKWRLLSAALIIPRPIRDAVYRFIAINRYRWIGQTAACRISSAEERALFLP